MYFNAEKMFRMCLRKKKFASYSSAQSIAKECDQKYGKTHRVYYCSLCGGYHLTTKEKFIKTKEKIHENK